MHDLHVANQIHKQLLAAAQAQGWRAVKVIEIELGVIEEHGADITEENLKFNLEMLNQGTLAEGADIIIKKVPGNHWKLVSLKGD